MKTLVVICTLMLTVVFTNAHPLTQQYLAKIPSLPKDTCNITKNNMKAYLQKIKVLIDEIDG